MSATASPPAKLEMREKAFGHDHVKTLPERFGHWLSERRILQVIGTFGEAHRGLRLRLQRRVRPPAPS